MVMVMPCEWQWPRQRFHRSHRLLLILPPCAVCRHACTRPAVMQRSPAMALLVPVSPHCLCATGLGHCWTWCRCLCVGPVVRDGCGRRGQQRCAASGCLPVVTGPTYCPHPPPCACACAGSGMEVGGSPPLCVRATRLAVASLCVWCSLSPLTGAHHTSACRLPRRDVALFRDRQPVSAASQLPDMI